MLHLHVARYSCSITHLYIATEKLNFETEFLVNIYDMGELIYTPRYSNLTLKSRFWYFSSHICSCRYLFGNCL